MTAQAQAMDRMYRYQRHIYDLTRKYYLFGRDTLLQRLPVDAGTTVMEVGCGTGRNLMKLARLQPQGRLFGIDASEQMLVTARAKAAARGDGERIRFCQGLAEELDYRDFGLEAGFDIVIFSYAFSMIRPWKPALQAGLDNLKPGGSLFIVDFSDQRRLPAWFGRMLQGWLARFGVHHEPELIRYLQSLHEQNAGELVLESIGRDYAYLARFHKKG